MKEYTHSQDKQPGPQTEPPRRMSDIFENMREPTESELDSVYDRARSGEISFAEQLSTFFELSEYDRVRTDIYSRSGRSVKESTLRMRHTIIGPDSRISIRRNDRMLGEPFGVVLGGNKITPVRKALDCLDITDMTLFTDSLAPLEEFVSTAVRVFPGNVINFENVTDPQLEEWCRVQGWQKHDKYPDMVAPPDYYLKLAPFKERQKIITTKWERTALPAGQGDSKEDGSQK